MLRRTTTETAVAGIAPLAIKFRNVHHFTGAIDAVFLEYDLLVDINIGRDARVFEQHAALVSSKINPSLNSSESVPM